MHRRRIAISGVALAAVMAAAVLLRARPGVDPASAPPAPARVVLDSPMAGSWFPADADALRRQIEACLDSADRGGAPSLPAVQALILPHAGYRWSGITAAAGIRQLRGRHYDRVVVIGPSHHAQLGNCAALPTFTHLRTPLGEVPVDTAAVRRLLTYPWFVEHPEAMAAEHSYQNEVPFLQAVLGDFQLLPVVVGHLDEDATRSLARLLAASVDARTLVVASSDFTHYGPNYGYVPFPPDTVALRQLDMGAFEAIRALDAAGFRSYCQTTGATICGRDAIAVLLQMLSATARVERLAYTTSGQLTGDLRNSVSYVAAAVVGAWPAPASWPEAAAADTALSTDDERALLALARATLRYAFEHRRAPEPEQLGVPITPPMRAIRGAFVTLHEHGRLRGCVGEIRPTRPLYQAVVAQALNAAFADRRFQSLQPEELSAVELEISVLTPPAQVPSSTDIVIGRDGVILHKDGRSAVFLPQVASEQGWDLAQTLSQLSLKAGLPADAWRSGARFQVFQARVFHEDGSRT